MHVDFTFPEIWYVAIVHPEEGMVGVACLLTEHIICLPKINYTLKTITKAEYQTYRDLCDVKVYPTELRYYTGLKIYAGEV